MNMGKKNTRTLHNAKILAVVIDNKCELQPSHSFVIRHTMVPSASCCNLYLQCTLIEGYLKHVAQSFTHMKSIISKFTWSYTSH